MRIKTVNTPVGEFSRKTNTDYKFAVIWNCPRAKETYDKYLITSVKPRLATDTRWIKDKGYAVTWHSTKQSAEKKASGSYDWDKSSTVLGIYEVTA
jgi:hypothetical protein